MQCDEHGQEKESDFARFAIPWEENWSDVTLPDMDEKTRSKITSLIDKLGQIEVVSSVTSLQLDQIFWELVDLDRMALSFLLKGMKSSNLHRAQRCIDMLASLGELKVEKMVCRQQTQDYFSVA